MHAEYFTVIGSPPKRRNTENDLMTRDVSMADREAQGVNLLDRERHAITRKVCVITGRKYSQTDPSDIEGTEELSPSPALGIPILLERKVGSPKYCNFYTSWYTEI